MCPKTIGIVDISTKMVGFLHDHLTLTFLEQLIWNTKCILVIKVHIYLYIRDNIKLSLLMCVLLIYFKMF